MRQKDGAGIFNKIIHAVTDKNHIHPILLCVLSHACAVVAQVQEVDFRKVLAEEGRETIAVAVPYHQQPARRGIRIADDIKRGVAAEEGGVFVLLRQEAP